MQCALLQRGAQRPTGSQQVRLAGVFIKVARTHARGQRLARCGRSEQAAVIH